VADGIIVFESDLGELLRVEHPPKTVIGAAVGGHHSIELILGSAFQVAQVLAIGHDAACGERRVNALAIGEEQRVANVEEDGFDVRVNFRGSSTSRSVVSASTAFRE